ncbi:MAG: hypothetical protein LBL54_03765, partial [Clostridiales Family XIII bacterium]|nr:hypothetical protein [Clostridiales Family XIII bacterium]
MAAVTEEYYDVKKGLALKIGYAPGSEGSFVTERETVPLDSTDFTDIAVAVIRADDAGAADMIGRIEATGFGLPV